MAGCDAVGVEVLFDLFGEPDGTRGGKLPVRGKANAGDGDIVGVALPTNPLHEYAVMLCIVALRGHGGENGWQAGGVCRNGLTGRKLEGVLVNGACDVRGKKTVPHSDLRLPDHKGRQ